jgi:PAS domain S-box-containing protein
MASALTMAVTTYVDWQAVRLGTRQTEQTRRILESTQQVLSGVKDAETSQRGYLLTGDDSYLAPYDAAKGKLTDLLGELSAATAAKPDQLGRVVRIQNLTRQKFAEMAETIRVARAEGRASAVAIVRTNSGKATMDAIRSLCAAVSRDEYRDLVVHSQQLQREAEISRVVVMAGGIVLVCLLAGAERAVTRAFTRRDQAMRELDDSRRLFQTTLMGIGDAVICTDARGDVTLINPVAQQLTEWRQEEAAGRPLETVFRIVQETSREPVESPVAKVLREGTIVGLANHTILITRNGSEVPIDDSGAPIRDLDGRIVGVVLVFRNITERRTAERTIRDNEERFRTLASAFPELVWSSQGGGQIEYVNPRGRNFAGWGADQSVREELWFELIHPEERQRYQERWSESLRTGDPFEMQCRLRRAVDGAYRWFLCRAAPVRDSGGRTTRWIATCTDIHEQMESAENLRHANEALQQSNADLEQFAYAASHDLQEPLRMVAIYSQLLQQEYQDRLDQHARSYIAFAVNGALRMEALLKDLLFYSRVSSGPANSNEVVDANAALQIALLNLESAIRESAADLEVSELPEVAIPELHLIQLFQNLIGNAIKYRGAAVPHLQVRAQREGPRWLFSVRDNGIGIDAQYQTHIFGVFKRLHGQEYEGTGIGLAMCQKIVERNGGRIWVESERGKGSIFFFTLRARAHQPKLT